MDPIVIDRPDPGAVQLQSGSLIKQAEALAVTTQPAHRDALVLFSELKALENRVVSLFREPKSAAHKAHRAITNAEKQLLTPIKLARQVLSNKCDAYEEEQERIAAEEARKREEAARKAAEEAQLAEAQAAQDAGDMAQAEEILAEEIPLPVVQPEPEVAKVDGVSTQTRWSAEVVDMLALVKHVAANPDLIELVAANQPALNRLAVSLRGGLKIPGVRAVSKTIRMAR
jgi:hypothetical protein